MDAKFKILFITTSFVFASGIHAQSLCVFDPLGTSGDNFSMMKDYALAANQWGANITLKPYTDERLAAADYKSGKCDAAAITGIRSHSFNKFVGTISAPVALLTEQEVKTAMALVANPKLSAEMIENDNEVAGLSSFGFAYIMTRDRKSDTMLKMQNLRFGVLSYDKVQQASIEKFGGTTIPYELAKIVPAFNSGAVDVVILPAIVFKPLELYKGMGTQGAIFKFPLAEVTFITLIHPVKFPDGYGQKSRTWFAARSDQQMAVVREAEKSIDSRYWATIPANVASGYLKLLREVRLSLYKEGFYDKKMLHILKNLRCRSDPNNYECSLTDE